MGRGNWRDRVEPKAKWGSHPNRERGGSSYTERTYLSMIARAQKDGTAAALDPHKTEQSCPTTMKSEDYRSTWMAAFKAERRRVPA